MLTLNVAFITTTDTPELVKYISLNVLPLNTLTIIPKCPILNVINQDQPRRNLFPRINRYTLDIFLQRAKIIHGNKFNYDKIRPDHIITAQSKVPITCNKCGYEFEHTITAHIDSKRGCLVCAKQVPWTLNQFIQKAQEIHGDKFDYSKITQNHIHGAMSYVPIVCKLCDHEWNSKINDHINGKNGCSACSRKISWTLTRFLKEASEIHGDNYDYSKITSEYIQGVNGNIPIICKKCNYNWSPTIQSHINSKRKCPNCSRHAPWTLIRFLERASEIHSDNYDYSGITSEHIHIGKSKVPILCRKCNYSWSPTIQNHIFNKTTCPNCTHNALWTLERFIIQANEVHGNLYDYSQITSEYIQGAKSHIPIICQKCNYNWNPSINNHINNKTGCPMCRPHGYSKAQIKWLEDIMISQKIIIHHALSPSGEYTIPEIGKVDGFCELTNTVYEYHGNYWHGNPDIYTSEDINPSSKKTFGELYNKTIERDNKIKAMGYNLVVKWETDIKPQ